MRYRHAITALLLLATSAGLASSWETSSFRTANGQLVSKGMAMPEVLRDAGEPLTRQQVSQGISTGDKVGLSVEVWTYRGGDGVYTVTFTGTRVTRIEVTPDR
jgi:hypothetical protein